MVQTVVVLNAIFKAALCYEAPGLLQTVVLVCVADCSRNCTPDMNLQGYFVQFYDKRIFCFVDKVLCS